MSPRPIPVRPQGINPDPRDKAWRDVWAMVGMLGWEPNSIWPLTWRIIVIAHDAKVLTTWDQTSIFRAEFHNLRLVIISQWSKHHGRAMSPYDFHPYRKKRRQGFKLTPGSMGEFREFISGMMGR